MREPAGKRIFIGAILLSSGFSSINLKALNVSGSLEPALVFALERFECQSTCKCFTGYQLRLVEELLFLANLLGLCTTCVDG